MPYCNLFQISLQTAEILHFFNVKVYHNDFDINFFLEHAISIFFKQGKIVLRM
jgi:hypothetical protein